MKRINFVFAIDSLCNPHIVTTEDEKLKARIKGRGSSSDFEYLRITGDFPTRPGLYQGVLNMTEDKNSTRHYSLTNYAKIENRNKKLLTTIAALILKHGGEVSLAEAELRQVPNSFQIRQEKGLKKNDLILKVIKN